MYQHWLAPKGILADLNFIPNVTLILLIMKGGDIHQLVLEVSVVVDACCYQGPGLLSKIHVKFRVS